MTDELYERALDALLAAEAGRFAPEVAERPDLDAWIIAAIRASTPPVEPDAATNLAVAQRGWS